MSALASQSIIRGRIGKLEVVAFRGVMGAEIKGLNLRRLDECELQAPVFELVTETART